MPVTSNELILRPSILRPTNDVDPAGGGLSTNEIDDNTIGLFLPSIFAEAEGGTSKIQYQKFVLENTHTSDSLYNSKFYLPISLNDLATSGPLSFRINDSTDATDTVISVLGQNSTSAYQSEDVDLGDSTDWVTGAKIFKSGAGGIIEVLIKNGAGALKNISQDGVVLEVMQGTNTVGSVPKGFHSGHGNLYMFIEGTLNNTATVDNRFAEPAGALWSKPNTIDDACTAADTIGAGDYQGGWIKQIAYPGMTNLSDANGRIAWSGSDS
jgi:hypothetical protein